MYKNRYLSFNLLPNLIRNIYIYRYILQNYKNYLDSKESTASLSQKASIHIYICIYL